MTGTVKSCPLCAEAFTAEHLMRDPQVVPIGMLIEDADLGHASYFFNHGCRGCGTTFAVPIDSFAEFIREPIPADLLQGSEGCQHQCSRLHDLTGCDQPCAGAPYRRFLVDTLVRRRRTMPLEALAVR